MVSALSAARLPQHDDCANAATSKIVGQELPQPHGRATRAPAFRQAAAVILHVVRNSAVAVVAAWCASWMMTLGNVFSSASPVDQSLRSFTLALVVWTVVLDAIAAAGLQGASLSLVQVLSSPTTQQLHLVRCVGVLLWRTSQWLVMTVVVCAGVAYAFCAGGPSVRKWKPYFYFTAIACHVYRTRIIQEARRLLKFFSKNTEGHATRHVIALDSSWRRLLPKNILILLSVYVATAYVQGTTEVNLESPVMIFAFAVGSLVVKLALQEMMIHTTMQRKRIRIEQMHAMIAVPTVLIDTQVRILLLRANQVSDASSSRGVSIIQLPWLGSLLLAVFEIIIRAGRTWWLHRKIHRRWHTRNLPRRRMVRFVSRAVQPLDGGAPSSTSTSEDAFRVWKSRRVALHAAEAQADMHAEYIAIGCSLSIYQFCHGHPKFSIQTTDTPSMSVSSRSSVSYAAVVVFQVVVELVVDFLCTSIEIASGICFEVPRNTGAFLVALYISCALGNITISTTMLLVSGQE